MTDDNEARDEFEKQLEAMMVDREVAALLSVKLLRDGRLLFVSGAKEWAVGTGFAAPFLALSEIVRSATGAIDTLISVALRLESEEPDGDVTISFEKPEAPDAA